MRNLSRAACVHMDHVLSGMLCHVFPSISGIYTQCFIKRAPFFIIYSNGDQFTQNFYQL